MFFGDVFVAVFGQLTDCDMIGWLALSFGQCQMQSFQSFGQLKSNDENVSSHSETPIFFEKAHRNTFCGSAHVNHQV